MEFSSGFTVSVLFLSLIPEACRHCSPWEIILFLLQGVFTAAFMQDRMKHRHGVMSPKSRIAASERLTLLCLGVSGGVRSFSAGTGFFFSPCLGSGLGIAAAVSLFPMGAAAFFMHRASGQPIYKGLIICLLLPLTCVLGLKTGLNFGKTDGVCLMRVILFCEGINLYTAVGDVGRESRALFGGRYLPLSHVSGMVCAVLLVLFN